MNPKHKKLVDKLVEKYKKDKSIIAITLFGSLARGKEREDSDIDISVFSEDAKKWDLLKKKINGIEVDFEICPKKHLFNQFKKYPYLCYDYINHKIVYDPQGIIKDFVEKLRKYLEKHPEVVEFWEEKLRIMNENKANGKDLHEAVKSYDEAEILFSKEHKVTRDFFR